MSKNVTKKAAVNMARSFLGKFEGVVISKTGVVRRDPATLVSSSDVQRQIAKISELKNKNS